MFGHRKENKKIKEIEKSDFRYNYIMDYIEFIEKQNQRLRNMVGSYVYRCVEVRKKELEKESEDV